MNPKQTQQPNLDSALLDFRVDAADGPNPAILEKYCVQYPQFARELTDYAVQWLIGDAMATTAASGSSVGQSSSGLVSRAISRLYDRIRELGSVAEAKLDFRSLNFLMLPEEHEDLNALLEQALDAANADEKYLARLGDFPRLIDALTKARGSHGVRNASVALALILDIAARHWTDLADGWLNEDGSVKHAGKVPIASILGDDMMPAAAAATLKRAVDKMLSAGEVESDERWSALEKLASAYLAQG